MSDVVLRTVTGDVPASSIGRTLIHEHLLSSLAVYWSPDDFPEIADRAVSIDSLYEIRSHPYAARANLDLDDISTAITEVGYFASAGGGTVVDVTSNGLARDARAVRYLAERVGVQVILGSGYYIGASHPPSILQRSPELIADEIETEIVTGIGATGVKAGVIGEVGAGTFPMSASERIVLTGAAIAQARTGAGMVVHPAPGIDSAFEVTSVLVDAGADPAKVVISHLDERFRGDVALFQRLAASGVVMAFDTFGRDIYYPDRGRQHPSDAARIDWLIALVEAGLGTRITLAQDICLNHELRRYGGHGYAHVLESILPRLAARGLDERWVEQMLVDTPRDVLSIRPHS